MIATTSLSLLQAVQLVALAPCLFVILFLIITCHDRALIAVPVAYFLALSSGFMLLLLNEGGMLTQHMELRGSLMLVESMTYAFSFLLVLQFMLGRVPPPVYWLILLVPLLGGSTLIYATLVVDNPCIMDNWCMPSEQVLSLYHILSSALIFLLLFDLFLRKRTALDPDDQLRLHKYWLIIVMVVMNVLLLGVNLAKIAEHISTDDTHFIETVLRIAFIYLVMTSLFRVFDKAFRFDYSRVPLAKPYVPSAEDHAIATHITALFEKEKLAQEMGISRERLADRLGISEHQLSRIMNSVLGKSFSALVNDYRVREATLRLKAEPDTAITVIAFEVGFSSIASFNRVFRDIVGCSPTEFRQK